MPRDPRLRSADCTGRCKLPAEEILFGWFRSVGELSVLIKRRHPEVQAEVDRVYQEHLAQLSKRWRDAAALDD